MKKITDYFVSSEEDLDTLQKDVKEKIGLGYQPFGHFVLHAWDDGAVSYMQPMVKYEE